MLDDEHLLDGARQVGCVHLGDDEGVGEQFGDAVAGVQFGGCLHLEGVLVGDDDGDGSISSRGDSSNDRVNDSNGDSSDIIRSVAAYLTDFLERNWLQSCTVCTTSRS